MPRFQLRSEHMKPATIGIVTGLVHLLISVLLWYRFEFESLLTLFSSETLYAAYVVVGMFVVGFVPGVLYAQQRAVSPLFIVVGLLALTGFGTWQTVQSNLTPVGPTPFGWYTLLWVGVLVIAGLFGGVELQIKQLG